jgi:hypothetical protein
MHEVSTLTNACTRCSALHMQRTVTQPEQFTHAQLPSPQRLRRVMESGTASPLRPDADIASMNCAEMAGSSSGCMFSAGLCLHACACGDGGGSSGD